MKKRMLTALLTCCLALSLAVPVSAAPAEDEVLQTAYALGLLPATADLSASLTRAELTAMAVKCSPGGARVGHAATSPYPDVPRSHWASGYVAAAVSAGLVSGYSDGTFRPDSPVTLADGAAIVLALLGYGPADFTGAYPDGQLALCRSLGLDSGLSARSAGAVLTRREAAYLFYNLMTARNKEGQVYLTTLGYSLNSAGEIDLVALLNRSMEGPVVAEPGWSEGLPLELSTAAVYRNGAAASAAALQDYDVIYWNEDLNALWAYSDKVTGTIQALEPSGANPTSVTVAGRTCEIETAAAAYALSSLGAYGLGDTVTLLLGRDGGVAAVTSSSAAAGERMGVVAAVDDLSYPDGRGGSYTAKSVTLLATDGRYYTYQAGSASLRVGSLVRVALTSQGEVALRGLSAPSLSGQVSGGGTRLGRYDLAEDVEILDVSGSGGVRISPARLAGLGLKQDDVGYYRLNAAGEIDRLILRDVTGDTHHYGILTSLVEIPTGGFSNYYTYGLEVAGTDYLPPQTTTRYPVELGPIRIEGDPADPEHLGRLQSAGRGEVSGGRFLGSEGQHTLSEFVAVYEFRDGDYYLSTLARVETGAFTLTGWYDKPDSAGGRLRVIVARAV